MKKFVCILLMLLCAQAFAGGAIGGNPGLAKDNLALELAASAFNVEALPKSYVGGDEFRRIRARLSVEGTESVQALVGEETIQVRKLKESIVDTKISKQLLPSDNVASEGGSLGGGGF